MNNIAPTGTECNRIYKHNFDVLYHNNARCVFSSPYIREFPIRISLAGSTPPLLMSDNGNWIVTINPDNDYTRQWNRTYKIKKRYIENYLQRFYNNWLKEFRDSLRISNKIPITIPNLCDELVGQGLVMQENPNTSQANIIKGAFYDFVGHYDDPIYQAGLLAYFNS